MLFDQKPKLSSGEKKEVACANLAQLEARLGKLFISQDGLVLESYLTEQISQLVAAATTSQSFDAIASQFGVSFDAVRLCVTGQNLYIDQSVVYGPRVLDQLVEAVPEEPVKSVDFCNKHAITFKLLQHLRDRIALVGDYVLKRNSLESKRLEIKHLLDSETPTELPESVLLDIIMSQIPYDGKFDRNTRVFTPTAYRNAQRDALYNRVKQEKVVAESEISFDVRKFAKRYELLTIPGYVLTQEYIQEQADLVKQKVESNGFFDFSELDLPIDQLLNLKYPQPVPGIVVKATLESKLKNQLCEWAANNGKQDSQQFEGDVQATSEARKLANQLKPPTTAAIKDHLHDLVADCAKLGSFFAQNFTVPVRQSYIDAAIASIEVYIKQAAYQVTARISAYLNGVLSCSMPLQQALFEEWQSYAGEADPAATVISSLDQAKEYFKVDDDTLRACIEQMNQANAAKFEKTKDSATVLHLAVVLYHSKAISQGLAILKCRGKHIPKLLKQFEFPECFSQLKTDVTKKNDPTESLAAVKSIIDKL